MLCKSYQNLTEVEQIEFIGHLVHIVQTSEHGFMCAKKMIEAGKEAGKFDKVKIGYGVFQEEESLTLNQ